ncbi:hypothetical protein Tco_0951306 [Tanacetum coccineum]|uniref:Uncharacterized protein n=1 Tax=Tanacetum coccineum TaxID=301880 RepID=A0ABQ5DTR2_9ASTR
MPLDCQLGIVAMWGEWEGFVKWLMECCRVEVWEQNRVLAGFGIGGKIGKRLKSQLAEKEAEAAEVVRLRDQFLPPIEEKSALTAGSVWPVPRPGLRLLHWRLSAIGLSLRISRREMEVLAGKCRAQACTNRVAELEAHMMDVSGRLEEEFYPTYLTLLAKRRRLLTHGIQLAILKCLKSSEYQGILGHALGRAVDFGFANNPEAARASYLDAVKALEDASFPLVDLLKSKKDAGMDEVPIHHAGDKTAVGETSLSFALMNVHARAEGAKKHAAALCQLMMEIVSTPLFLLRTILPRPLFLLRTILKMTRTRPWGVLLPFPSLNVVTFDSLRVLACLSCGMTVPCLMLVKTAIVLVGALWRQTLADNTVFRTSVEWVITGITAFIINIISLGFSSIIGEVVNSSRIKNLTLPGPLREGDAFVSYPHLLSLCLPEGIPCKGIALWVSSMYALPPLQYSEDSFLNVIEISLNSVHHSTCLLRALTGLLQGECMCLEVPFQPSACAEAKANTFSMGGVVDLRPSYMISSSFSFGAISIGSSAMSFFICLKATSASRVHWKSSFFVHFFTGLRKASQRWKTKDCVCLVWTYFQSVGIYFVAQRYLLPASQRLVFRFCFWNALSTSVGRQPSRIFRRCSAICPDPFIYAVPAKHPGTPDEWPLLPFPPTLG